MKELLQCARARLFVTLAMWNRTTIRLDVLALRVISAREGRLCYVYDVYTSRVIWETSKGTAGNSRAIPEVHPERESSQPPSTLPSNNVFHLSVDKYPLRVSAHCTAILFLQPRGIEHSFPFYFREIPNSVLRRNS